MCVNGTLWLPKMCVNINCKQPWMCDHWCGTKGVVWCASGFGVEVECAANSVRSKTTKMVTREARQNSFVSKRMMLNTLMQFVM